MPTALPVPRRTRNFYPFYHHHHHHPLDPSLVFFSRSIRASFSIWLHVEANAANSGLIVNEKSLHFRVQIPVPAVPMSFTSLTLPAATTLLRIPVTNSMNRGSLPILLRFPSRSGRQYSTDGLCNGFLIVCRECSSSFQPSAPARSSLLAQPAGERKRNARSSGTQPLLVPSPFMGRHRFLDVVSKLLLIGAPFQFFHSCPLLPARLRHNNKFRCGAVLPRCQRIFFYGFTFHFSRAGPAARLEEDR